MAAANPIQANATPSRWEHPLLRKLYDEQFTLCLRCMVREPNVQWVDSMVRQAVEPWRLDSYIQAMRERSVLLAEIIQWTLNTSADQMVSKTDNPADVHFESKTLQILRQSYEKKSRRSRGELRDLVKGVITGFGRVRDDTVHNKDLDRITQQVQVWWSEEHRLKNPDITTQILWTDEEKRLLANIFKAVNCQSKLEEPNYKILSKNIWKYKWKSIAYTWPTKINRQNNINDQAVFFAKNAYMQRQKMIENYEKEEEALIRWSQLVSNCKMRYNDSRKKIEDYLSLPQGQIDEAERNNRITQEHNLLEDSRQKGIQYLQSTRQQAVSMEPLLAECRRMRQICVDRDPSRDIQGVMALTLLTEEQIEDLKTANRGFEEHDIIETRAVGVIQRAKTEMINGVSMEDLVFPPYQPGILAVMAPVIPPLGHPPPVVVNLQPHNPAPVNPANNAVQNQPVFQVPFPKPFGPPGAPKPMPPPGRE